MDQLEERRLLALEVVGKLLEKNTLTKLHSDLVKSHKASLSNLFGWLNSDKTEPSPEELQSIQSRLNEVTSQISELSKQYAVVNGLSGDTRIVKYISDQFGSHVAPLPGTYEIMNEQIEQFYGTPEDEGYRFVVNHQDLHISSDFELEWIYGNVLLFYY
jgi:hypothetical protein